MTEITAPGRCSKCGGNYSPRPTYMPAISGFSRGHRHDKDWIVWTCMRCGHQLEKAPLDRDEK